MKRILFLLVLLVPFSLAQTNDDETLIIAFQGGATTLDPMMRNETTTLSWQRHIFNNLTRFDREGQLQPVLATSWENIDKTTWHIKVRPDVTFHNGNAMTAEDVAFSIMRAATHPLSQMKGAVGIVTNAVAIDEETVEITTSKPDPLLPQHLEAVRVVPKDYLEEVGDDAFAEQPVGTGPYKFVEWLAQDHLTLEAYEEYWGDQPEFKQVQLVSIPNGATRVAALLSGEVDVAEKILPQDFARIEQNPDTYLTKTPGIRTIYLAIDGTREVTPGLLSDIPNPFLKPKVKEAVYRAINIEAITERIMGGAANPASQFLSPIVEGFNEEVGRYPYDPELARQLLAEAGYEDGFAVRLDAPNDRYLNDALIAQAIGGMLEEVGIQVEVNAVPKAVFFPEHFNNGNSTMAISGWASMDSSTTLTSIFHCPEAELGYGRFNPSWYCNPEVDAMIEEAITIFDPAKRDAAIQEIMATTHEDIAYIPLHFESVVAGVQEGVEWTSRPDEYIFAWQMTKQ